MSGSAANLRMVSERAVDGQRRDDGVDAAAVGQAGVDHRAGLVDAAADAGHDLVDRAAQVGLVGELGVGGGEHALALQPDVLVADRRSGFSTAYVGSSNLTHSAQVTGLEWNVRVSGARNPDVIDKVAAVFESYWNSGDFVPYDADEFAAATSSAASGPVVILSPIELRPEPFQERLLEQIALSRERGHHRNLLVSATGTGKTVMAALDYARLRERLPRSRLLFVAHREEILDQSLATFRHALRDHAFGEMWVGGQRPRAVRARLRVDPEPQRGRSRIPRPRHFDVVIVDEFHHAAAPSYRALLDHVQPSSCSA